MKLTLASVTLLLAALAVAAPQNKAGKATKASTGNGKASNGTTNAGSNTNNGNNNGGNTNVGNSTTNAGGNTNAGTNNGGNTNAGNGATVDAATGQLMQLAVDGWMRDTGVVSNFLNTGGSLTDEQTFKNQALIAHSAEVDELTHKNVLDQFMPNNQNVKAANSTLSNGAFQLVVDQLQNMADNGRSQMGGIDLINKDRCINVLPNIDMYMREAALTIGMGRPVQQSVRPAACSNIQAGQNGALNVNQPPPGYTNGKLQNGKSNTNPNIPATPADDDPK
jgi:hypothetical protein